MWYVIVGMAVAVALFLWWRYTSVARGARGRDEKILQLPSDLLDMPVLK